MLHLLWRMRPYFRQVAGLLLVGSIAGIVMNTSVVLPAVLLGRALDVAAAFARGDATTADVAWAAAALVGGVLMVEAPRIGKRWWLITANNRIRASVRADALRGVLAWPLAELYPMPVGDLMARIVGDVEVLGVGIREFTIETWDTLLFSVSLVVAMLLYDAPLTVLALSPVPLAMLLAQATGRWVIGRTAAARQANGALTTLVQEQLAGVRVLRLFGRTSASAARVGVLAAALAHQNLRVARLKGGLQPVYTTLMSAGALLLVWQGSERVLAGAMTVGAFVAYLELFLRFVARGHRIPQLFNALQSAAAAYARLQPLLAPLLPPGGPTTWASFRSRHVPAPPKVGSEAAEAQRGAAALSLEGVGFRYPGAERPALHGISLRVPAGALVAVTGPVGAGKSALLRAIAGIYPLETGTVLVDGASVGQLAPAARAARIGYLPQDPVLFSGSLRQNLLPHQPQGATADQALTQALELADVHSDVAALPGGVDTPVGELGARLSGGQRQRLALARALVAGYPARPGLLLLDDPFSAVDVATEARIIAGLRAAFGPSAPPEQQMTIVLCSHRLAAFPQADLVVMLRDGKVAEVGAHAELVQQGGFYARVYQAQAVADAAPPTEVPA